MSGIIIRKTTITMTPMIIPAITAADRLAEVGAAEVGVAAVLVVVTTGTNG